MTTIQLYGFAGSTYVRSTMIACEELKLDWELLPLQFGQASHLALHPFGKMPVLKHGPVTLYETLAILCYLNDLSDGATLTPDGALPRAHMWQVLSICIDYAYPALVKASFADDKTTIETEPAERCLDALAALMGSGSCLTGDRVSLADLVFEPMLSHYLGNVPVAEEQLDGRPSMKKWYHRMRQRPALIATYKENQSE